MKKIFLTVIVAIAAFLSAHAQDEMFKKLGNEKNISVVYISKALLGLAGNMNIGDANISSLAGKLTMLEIYSSEDPNAIKLMKNESEKLLNDGSELETLMKAKEGGEVISFVGKKGKDGNISELLMIADETNEFSIIRLIGNFTMKDIEKVTGGK
ncbi:MAG: DUF4252 domain-containing protein [Paludibacter sp.]|nr:DUF4252 domain-containing protein [Paludibacter sp.]